MSGSLRTRRLNGDLEIGQTDIPDKLQAIIPIIAIVQQWKYQVVGCPFWPKKDHENMSVFLRKNRHEVTDSFISKSKKIYKILTFKRILSSYGRFCARLWQRDGHSNNKDWITLKHWIESFNLNGLTVNPQTDGRKETCSDFQEITINTRKSVIRWNIWDHFKCILTVFRKYMLSLNKNPTSWPF